MTVRARPVAPRSVLAVPGSSAKMLGKARGLDADEVFCDLEDAVAPDAKAQARATVVAALQHPDWRCRRRAVRVNGWHTPWTTEDVIAVVGGAGVHIDSIILPKVARAAQVIALDLILTQLEQNWALPPGAIGVQAQIEDAGALLRINEIATATPRLEALVIGPADMAASLGMRTLTTGTQPDGYTVGDAHHHVLMSVLVAARAHGLAAIDGPFLAIDDADGLRGVAAAAAALGYDGKWAIHPSQVDPVNEIFTPRQADYDAAEDLLEAYAEATSVAGGRRGAVRHRGEMIDEASAAMARGLAARGRAAGLRRSTTQPPPAGGEHLAPPAATDGGSSP
ncbi:CoA ester lyase [Williamsia sp. CHRR-6]|uniref:HpcH/HpaI aldolase/citrate lyase family protein n=1 Tax=Williamsia sp. CHRR-6 TaxID=2835871 RepID=UPI001BD959AE|nr:CoA ester lyase [Williamsia sp. CHRR-6]MBT0568463.1 CoA ester lyase [Williamsia sp. CHRR-6]